MHAIPDYLACLIQILLTDEVWHRLFFNNHTDPPIFICIWLCFSPCFQHSCPSVTSYFFYVGIIRLKPTACMLPNRQFHIPIEQFLYRVQCAFAEVCNLLDSSLVDPWSTQKTVFDENKKCESP